MWEERGKRDLVRFSRAWALLNPHRKGASGSHIGIAGSSELADNPWALWLLLWRRRVLSAPWRLARNVPAQAMQLPDRAGREASPPSTPAGPAATLAAGPLPARATAAVGGRYARVRVCEARCARDTDFLRTEPITAARTPTPVLVA